MAIDRRSRSPLAKWWQTIDKSLLLSVLALMAIGFVLVMAGSPPVAERINVAPDHFIIRQAGYLAVGLCLMLGLSFLTPPQIRLTAFAGLAICALLMVLVLFFGMEVKGAKRWINLPIGMSIQPSEFLKPLFAIVAAWLFAKRYEQRTFPGHWWSGGLFALFSILLLLQPDMGMTITLTLIWAGQFFLAGLPLVWVGALVFFGIGGLIAGYMIFPHVAKRINDFLNPESSGNYQLNRALEAFENGGWFGVGSGQGAVKRVLPDAHTDFIFSVAAEEHGLVMVIALLLLISYVIYRGWRHAMRSDHLFTMLAISGLMIQFAAQSMINIGVNLGLLPTKGMTLPLISYGGSSTLAVTMGMGFVLALTRKRYGSKGLERLRQPNEQSYFPATSSSH